MDVQLLPSKIFIEYRIPNTTRVWRVHVRNDVALIQILYVYVFNHVVNL